MNGWVVKKCDLGFHLANGLVNVIRANWVNGWEAEKWVFGLNLANWLVNVIMRD